MKVFKFIYTILLMAYYSIGDKLAIYAAKVGAVKYFDDILDEMAKEDGTRIVDPTKPAENKEDIDDDGEGGDEDDDDEGGDEDDDGDDNDENDDDSESEEEEEEEGDDDEPNDDDKKFLKTASKYLGQDFKSIDDIKKKLTGGGLSSEEVDNYEVTIEKLENEINELKKGNDPLQFFASKEEYIRQQVMKKYPELDAGVLAKALDSNKIDKLSPVEILKMKFRLEDPEIFSTDADLDAYLEDEYGFDPETSFEEQENKVQIRIKKQAKEAKKFFNELTKDINVPDREQINKEVLEQRQNIEQQWKPKIAEISKGVKNIKFEYNDPDGEKRSFDFIVKDKDLKEMLDEKAEDIAKAFAERGIKFSDKKLERVIAGYKKSIIADNFEKILSSFFSDIMTEVTEKEFQRYHNPTTKRKKQRGSRSKTSVEVSKEKAEAELLRD